MHAPPRPSPFGSGVALVVGIAIVALGLGRAGAAADQPVSGPRLTDVSATGRTSTLFTVDGAGFTPGGRIYLAVYDQLGTRLYETRSVTASLATTVRHHEMGEGPNGGYRRTTPGGALHEAFDHLCGATAMMRALDQTTATWSNWLTVEPACPRR